LQFTESSRFGQRPIAAHQQRIGLERYWQLLEMVNLLVGIAIGLSVLSAATFWVNFQWQHSKEILQRSRAQQEISALMETLVHDLRRAHFHSSSMVNNGSQDAHCPSQFCGALEDFQVSAQQILFSVDRNENGIKENNECSGFRFYANQVQIKTACKPVVWTALTKLQHWDILAFEIQLQCDPASLSQVVNLTMAIRKQLSSDTTAMAWQRQVRLRNASTRPRYLEPSCQRAGS
jgi:type IV pilus assembly protein PilW